MEWTDSESPRELETFLRNGNIAEAEALIDGLVTSLDPQRGQPRLVETEVAKKVLATLRRFAKFDRMFSVGSRIQALGQRDPRVRLQLAQAQIENGDLTGAIEELVVLRDELEEKRGGSNIDPTEATSIEFELGEALGLLGRAYKQLYVNARPRVIEPRIEDLNRALDFYGRAYRERLGDYLWHGINHVALLTRAQRVLRGRSVYSDEARTQAKAILVHLEDKETREHLQPWDAANRAEALLALGRNPEAVDAVKAYLGTPGVDAFNVQSTRRQFEEIWLLSEGSYPGSQILPMMTARFAELGGGRAEVDLTSVDESNLERVWGETGYKPLRWLASAVDRARSVARIGPNMFEGFGTGFLVDGKWIDASWTERNLLLTNAHVCTSDKKVQSQFPYPKGHDYYKAVFLAGQEAGAQPVEVDLREELFTSPPSELDATLLLVGDLPAGAKPPPRAEPLLEFEEWGEKRVNVIGHPKGLDVRVSMQDNELVGVGERYLHYRTPTDPGSSGSPIFNQDWDLVGIHHSAAKTRPANEGIRLDRIIAAVRRKHFS